MKALRKTIRFAVVVSFLTIVSLARLRPAETAPPPKISYEVNLDERSSHIYNVTMTIDGPHRDFSVLELPVWQPGWYAPSPQGSVISFEPSDENGKELPWRPTLPTQYRVETKNVSQLRIHYRVYATVDSVGTNNVLKQDWGSFNGTRLFLYLRANDGYPEPGPVALHVALPDGWQLQSGLLKLQHGPGHFVVPSYDVLGDSPTLLAREFQKIDFQVDGKTYHIVIRGHGTYDLKRLAQVAQAVIESEVAMMGSAGYSEYWLLFTTGESTGGGMEHLNSSMDALTSDRWELPPDRDHIVFDEPMSSYVLTVAHEHYHSWNPKRIRFEQLRRILYSASPYTRRVDIAEGFTDYYTAVHFIRSGYGNPAAMFNTLEASINAEEALPRDRVHSVGDRSFYEALPILDPFFGTADRATGVYEGSRVRAFMLDMMIRHDTHGEHSLDDVMRFLYSDWKSKEQNEFYSTGGVYGEDEWPELIKKVTGDAAAGDAFRRWWDTTELPPWKQCLAYAGLELVEDRSKVGQASLDADLEPVRIDGADGGKAAAVPRQSVTERVALSRVYPRGAVESAGLMSGDVLIAINGLAATEPRIRSILAEKHPGEKVRISYIREAVEQEADVTLSANKSIKYSIRIDPDATPEQKKIFDDYLNGRPYGTGKPYTRPTSPL
jgi:predicted metalloprotease with PDZ domain